MTRDEQIALLRLRIEQSPCSASEFARDVLLREPRTVRRWLSGGQIPHRVLEFLTDPKPHPWP